MIPAIPLRFAVPVVAAFALVSWASLERAGRHAAQARLEAARQSIATLEARVRQMEIRRHEEDRALREPNPVERLRDEWQRP